MAEENTDKQENEKEIIGKQLIVSNLLQNSHTVQTVKKSKIIVRQPPFIFSE